MSRPACWLWIVASLSLGAACPSSEPGDGGPPTNADGGAGDGDGDGDGDAPDGGLEAPPDGGAVDGGASPDSGAVGGDGDGDGDGPPPPVDLGVLAPGESLSFTGPGLAALEVAHLTVAFTAPVFFEGAVAPDPLSADVDVRVRAPTGATLLAGTSTGGGVETVSGDLPSGTVLLDIEALDAIDGFTLTIEVRAPSHCGDGFVSGNEGCDDADTVPGDGCSATCAVEFGAGCFGEPSTCAPLPHLGDFAGPETLPTVVAGPLEDGASTRWTIRMLEDVFVTGQLVVTDPAEGGDLDLRVVNAAGEGFARVTIGPEPETFAMEHLFAGLYEVRVRAYEDVVSFSLDVDVLEGPECGNGAVELFESCDDGDLDPDDGCDEHCAPEFGWVCEGAPQSLCEAWPLLGPLSGESTAGPLPVGPLAAFEGVDYRLEVSAPAYVTLEADALDPDGADLDLVVSTASGSIVGSAFSTNDPETLGPLPLPAGSYRVELSAYDLDVESATLSASSTPGPTCGDGELAPDFEQCDDGGDMPGDGCSATCVAELGFVCTPPPAGCVGPTELGLFDLAEAVHHEDPAPIAPGESRWLRLELAQPARLVGMLGSLTTGDPDLFLMSPEGEVLASYESPGLDEAIDVAVQTGGELFLEIYAWPGAGEVDGFTLSLSVDAP